jgi:hypothetical protein
MNLWNLKKGDVFVFDDDPDTQLLFLGWDGMYCKVQALDPEKNKEMCARYDAHSDFFALISWAPLHCVVPECFAAEQPEGGAP